MAVVGANYRLPLITGPSGGCTEDTWTPTSTTNAPDARDGHTAVWTGSEMIVWGGYNGSPSNTGGDIIPAPIPGQQPAPQTRPMVATFTPQCGLGVK